MSSIPFELFLSYLQDNKYMTLLRFVNQYFNIHIMTGKLTPSVAIESAGGSSSVEEGIVGHTNDQLEEFHEINNMHLEKVTSINCCREGAY
jgi:transcription initiation factor TFIID subunit 5